MFLWEGIFVKKMLAVIALLALLLTGCAAEETFETIADDPAQQVLAEMRQISVQLPSEAASPTVESGSDRLYQCSDYEISVQTLEGGDLSATIKTLSGYEKDSLTVMQTQRDGYDCYEFVWASVGELGDRVGRGLILDDGSYHYCVAILGDADSAEANEVYWDEMFRSVTLS